MKKTIANEVETRSSLKIYVYAIARNESKFVDRWMDSMSEADGVYVLDTGSTDDTVGKLKARGAHVEAREIRPWRFDDARNESMKLVPDDADILVCTDPDEFFLPGWRAKLESAWRAALASGAHPTTAEYEYVWNFNPDGTDGMKFTYEKIHAPGVCSWVHPVHEILAYEVPENHIKVDGVRLEHHADPAKSRGQYLELLEMSVDEDPDDDRNMHYLGREYMFRGMWDRAIETLKRHLAMPSARWAEERASSMRFIGRCYVKKGDRDTAELWLRRATDECRTCREPALELMDLLYSRSDWKGLAAAADRCLEVTERSGSYMTESEPWGAKPWDLASLGYWFSGRPDDARRAVKEALKLSPDDPRLKRNAKSMGL